MSAYLTHRLRGPDRRVFLPDKTSHGHYQIELACNACHTPMMGVKEDSCIECHGAELKLANDSHPKSKFTDPRNADRLKLLDASNCLTCHKEHMPERTGSMGVSLPGDYCFHCHNTIAQERPSHKDFAFDSCANAGCHNYHDNTALYEDFLTKHLHEPKYKEPAEVPKRQLLAFLLESETRKPVKPLTTQDSNAPTTVKTDAKLLNEWATTAHAQAGVNCRDCHEIQDANTKTLTWQDKLDHNSCTKCHDQEVKGFLGGKHGMRLAANLSPMQPGMARLPMKPEAAHRDLNCISCHGSHDFDTRRASVDSCLSCHNDSHSLAYKNSTHFTLFEAELKGETATGTGVSCATCHLPRELHREDGVTRVLVQHNQNLNLRPNEKMIRGVCLNCHGMEFTLDSLADAALIRTNFNGRPSIHVESLDLAERRKLEKEPRNTNPESTKK